MTRLITITLFLLATSVQAEDLTIVETDEGIIAKYSGTLSEKSSEHETPSMTATSADATRVQYLTSQVEKLKREADEILELSGNESEDELMLKNGLVDEMNRQMEMHAEEIRQLTGDSQPHEGVSKMQQKKGREITRQLKAWKKLGTSAPSDTSPE
jgi:hypothetical protein